MGWKIWPDRGFCALNNDISAYIDFEPTPSGAIRCVGPFAPKSFDIEYIETAIAELTLEIEENYLEPSQYILWGGYVDEPDYEEHKLNILGTTCGFVPAPWIRTQVLGLSDLAINREWISSASRIAHRSGLQFPESQLSITDPQVFHPSNLEIALIKLTEFARKLVSNDNLICQPRLPHVRWHLTMNEISQTAQP